MKKKHSKYRKIWLLWVALEGLVATFAIMNSFLLLRYLYFSHGTAIPEASVSAAGSVLSAVYLPLLITLILTTGFLEHKLSANVTNLMDGLRAVAGGDYSVRLKTDKHQLLDDLCEDFNRMTEELQSVRTLREDFVNSYSHEFKTPITAIKGFAELLSEPDLTEEERQQYLRIIQDESARLAELTNRTLLLTKLQSQRFLPDQTTFSLDEQIRRCAILCAHSWEEKRLTFSAELESVEYRDLVLYARRVILAALDGLPDGYRVLLTEHYFHNVPLVVAALLAGYSSRASASEAHRRALRHLRTYSKYKGELRACLDAFEEVTPYLSAAGNTGAGSYIRTGISSTEGAAIAGI